MKPSVIAAALLALASCTPQPAVADMYLTPHGVQRVDLPPERFRKQGVSLVRFVENITKVCGRHAQSCAAGTVVVMPDPCGYAPEAYAAYMCRKAAGRKVMIVDTRVSPAPDGYLREYWAALFLHEHSGHAVSGWKHERK